ncbi:AMP-binding protein [Microbulbifer sp. S227A]|uniref:AMP-binding protein n=1 Tax=Microbulbifer sp. S227A TaxID=3415131 RepID=UPI003C7EAC8D
MFLPLSSLLAQGRDKAHTVALRAGRDITFAELRADVREAMRRLPPEPRVVLAAQDSYVFAVGLLALLHAGKTICLPQNQRPKTLEPLRRQGYGMLIDGVGQAPQCHPEPFTRLDPGACDIVMFTSGSTGEPKEIRKTLAQLQTEVAALDAVWGAALSGATVLATVTHQHIYGMLFKILWPLGAGRPFVVDSFEYWEQLLPWLDGKTCVLSSPAHLTRYPDTFKAPCPPAMVFSSGGPLPFGAAQDCLHRLGTLPVEVFGSTETGGIAHRSQATEDQPWTRFDPVEVAAVDDILHVRSPYLTGDGWYPMNDMVQFQPDGRFLLRGRNDRVAKIEGKRVSLPEVETCLTAHEWIDDAAVLVLDGRRRALGGVLVLNDAGQRHRQLLGDFRFGQRLRRDLGQRFESAALPRQWRVVQRMPQTAQGKRILADLTALFAHEAADV